MKPIIGITSQSVQIDNRINNKITYTYIDAVVRAGGLPIILPIMKSIESIEEYMDIIDGIIFTGGEDLSPLYFNEEPLKDVCEINYDRDLTELEQFRIAYERDIPILGICRGIQLINVALGGTLYQDIYSQHPGVMGHSTSVNMQEGYHTIEVLEGTKLKDILHKKSIKVNSNHHQAIKYLGHNLKISAVAKDNIIEAIESTDDKPLLAVQFHPEAMAQKYEEFLNIFEYFVDISKLAKQIV